ncbi:MAG: hypothetical protein DWQ36_17040 [Acidobacteria bacterium]|nr:MAG: hypothetical protein DWQ30_05135 [Acidobacteriota bacterium]REK04557.1 MAG: hypothetical protein DWQ36_17040 [Acidobacteriota bacterium]
MALLVALSVVVALGAPLAAQSSAAPAEAWAQRSVGPLRLWSPPELAPQLDALAEDAAGWLPRLQRDLGPLPGGAPTAPFVIAVVDRGAWRRVAQRELPIPEQVVRRLDVRAPPWAAGYMLPSERIGVIRLDNVHRYPFDGAPTVLAHEVSHQLLHDRVGDRVPRWFDEAVATYEGRRRGLRDVAVLLSSTLFADVPPLRGLDYEFSRSEVRARRAYAASLEFLDWAIRRDRRAFPEASADDTLVRRLLAVMVGDPEVDFETAWRRATGEPLLVTEQEWRQGRWRLDRWVPVLFMNPTLSWAGLALLAVLAGLMRRRRSLEQRRRWQQEEDEESREALARWETPERGELVN